MNERDALSDLFQDGFLDIYSLRVAGSANITLGIKNKIKSSFFIKAVYSQTINWANYVDISHGTIPKIIKTRANIASSLLSFN